MSEQSTQAFLERMKTDEEFRDTILAEPEPEARLAQAASGTSAAPTPAAPTAPPTAAGETRPQLRLVRRPPS